MNTNLKEALKEAVSVNPVYTENFKLVAIGYADPFSAYQINFTVFTNVEKSKRHVFFVYALPSVSALEFR